MAKNKIEIKPENKGKFTNYCENKGHSGVTSECIREGLASKMASTRKQAQFALNSRKFKH